MSVKFETEEQLQEYLNNLGTEYRFTCFKEKNSEGCHLLGDYLESIKKDFNAAAQVFKSNCDDYKHPKSCYKYAGFSYLGKGCQTSVKESWSYYKTACELGYTDACLHTGLMLSKPEKDPKTNEPFMKADIVKGLEYIEKACSLQNPTACYFASGFYISGAEGVSKDRSKASRLSLTACEGGNVYACMNLSQMYKRGDGVEKDEKKSLMFKERARELRDNLRKKPSIGLQQYT